jgi:DNA-directed RNA polymerase specialized sigma24 family protein
MKKNFVLTQEDFEELLAWLAPDREEAGKKYEEIRRGLIRYFRLRGCSDSADLADETINRVAVKISASDAKENIKTVAYFYGFASKIYLEHVSRKRNKEVPLEPDFYSNDTYLNQFIGDESKQMDCLEECLAKLPRGEGEIIVMYYSKDKSAKFEMRKKLAESLSLAPGALHVKIHRIKSALKNCVEKCVEQK